MSLRIVTAPSLISAAFCCAASAEAETVPTAAKGNYHLPRGDAATMLRQFATISGSPVLFMMDKVQGEQTNSVDGEYTPSEALNIMLAGTSLEIMQETEIEGFVVGRKASSLQREVAGRDLNLQPKSDHNSSGESGKNESKMNYRSAKLITLILALFGIGSTASDGQVAPPAIQPNAQPNAQSSATAAGASDTNQSTLELDKYIVTGTDEFGKITELTSSFDVSMVSHNEITATTAAGVAGLLDAVPGFYGESSGGEVNQNLSVDGLRPGFFYYISLQEDGLPVMYDGAGSEFQIRGDATYDRVEVVRNGPSAVYAPEAASAIVNYITRMPATDQGDITISVTSEGNKRADFYYGGPIQGFNGWKAFIGGYYELGQGERPAGYNLTNGGQIRAGLEKSFSGGSLMITYKIINAHTAFYLPVPVAEGSDGKLSSIPGFDAHYDTLYSPELEYTTIRPPEGQGQPYQQAQAGVIDRTNQLTVKFEKDLNNGFHLSNGFRLASIYYQDNDDRSSGNSDVLPATQVLADLMKPGTFGDLGQASPTLASFAPGVVKDELVQVTGSGAGTVIANPATLNGNGLLANSDNFGYQGTFNNIMDDLRLSWNTDRNTLAVGAMYLDVDGTNIGEEGNDMLIDVRNHAHAYDIVGLNAQNQVVAHLTDNGVLAYDSIGAGYFGEGSQDTKSANYYIDDTFNITKQLRIDAGLRREEIDFATTAEGVNYYEPLPIAKANPSVIADQVDGSYGNGNYYSGSTNTDATAWSVGASYQLTDHLSVFARDTRDFDTGVQDYNLFAGQGLNSTTNPTSNNFEILKFQQAGVRFENTQFALSATAFYAQNDNTDIQETGAVDGKPTTDYLTYNSKGVDFEVVWKPIHEIQFNVGGVVQHSEIQGIPPGTTNGEASGNQVDRVPDIEFRVKSTLYFGSGNAFVQAAYYGTRYGDLANTELLGAYTNLGAGIVFNVTKDLSLNLVGDNLTNALAFTEGNPRGGSNINAGGSAYVFARPIWGRNAKLSCTLRF
jgi:iron complex outermembrane receptor protein